MKRLFRLLLLTLLFITCFSCVKEDVFTDSTGSFKVDDNTYELSSGYFFTGSASNFFEGNLVWVFLYSEGLSMQMGNDGNEQLTGFGDMIRLELITTTENSIDEGTYTPAYLHSMPYPTGTCFGLSYAFNYNAESLVLSEEAYYENFILDAQVTVRRDGGQYIISFSGTESGASISGTYRGALQLIR